VRKIFLKENDVVEISVKISPATFFSVQEKTTMTLLFLMFTKAKQGTTKR